MENALYLQRSLTFLSMKTIYLLRFLNANEVIVRISHRVFSDSKSAVAYGERVIANDRVCESFQLSVLFLD